MTDTITPPRPIRTPRGARVTAAREVAWSPRPVAIVIHGVVTAGCVIVGGMACALGGWWIVAGVYLYVNGAINGVLCLTNLFRFEEL